MATDFPTADHLLSLRLVFDTAAVVLIWLVQLVIYPAFSRFTGPAFRVWHPVYTRRVTYVVLPIMLGQLALYVYLVAQQAVPVTVLNLGLIGVAWALTFFGAVPIHRRLDGPEDHLPAVKRLLRVNAARTAVWTIVWGHTLLSAFWYG